MTETATLRAIHAAIGARPDVRLWRVQVGAAVPVSLCCARCRSKGVVRYGLPGMADLLGIQAPAGRLVSLEVKSATGKPTEEQVAWAAMVKRFGGVAAIVRSVEDAERALA